MINHPPGWASAPVGRIFKIVGGGTPSTTRPDFWKGTTPWISSADIDSKHNITPRKSVSELGIRSSATSCVPAGSIIVVTRVGLGKVGMAMTELCFSQDSQALVFESHNIDPSYVMYHMEAVASRFKEVGRGTTIAGVTKKQISDLNFLLPPRPEQLRIVAEIEKQFTRLDAGVAALEHGRLNLERYRDTVLKVACEGRLVPTEAELARSQKRDFEPGAALLKRIADDRRAMWEKEELARMHAGGRVPKDDRWKVRFEQPRSVDSRALSKLPEGWIWTSVEAVGLVRLGRQRSPKHQTGNHMRPYLRAANVFEGRIDVSDVLKMNFTPAEFATYCLKEGDILLNEGQSLELVGRPALYRGEVPGACFQNTLVRFRGSRFIVPTFALTLFRSYLRNQRFRRIARWTTNIAHLGAERFARIEFPLPPIAEQHRIVAQVDHHLSLIGAQESFVQRAAQRAKRLRLSILRIAFEGRLVQQDPTDEPAEALLERIYSERKTSSSAESKSGKKPSPLETWERFHA